MKQKQHEALGDPTKPVQLPPASSLLPPDIGEVVDQATDAIESITPQRDPSYRCQCGKELKDCAGGWFITKEEMYNNWAKKNGKPIV